MSEFRFTKTQHLRKPAQFRRVYDLQTRASDRFVLIFGASNDLGVTRIGLSISKKHGSAVRRARLRRLFREAFRLSQHDVPAGLDLILIPKMGVDPTLKDYRCSLVRLARQLARKVAPPDAQLSPQIQKENEN